MRHSEEAVAAILPEPPDGTMLVVVDRAGDRRVVWRDDADALDQGHASERWFDEDDSDPMALYEYVKYAEAVYRVPGQPIVHFE